MIKVPITVQFDNENVIGSVEIEEKFAEMLCTQDGFVVIRQAYLAETKELLAMSVCEEKESKRELLNEVKSLRHFRDSSVGLWCTDKEPKNKKDFFRLEDKRFKK